MWVTFVGWLVLGKITPFQKPPPSLFPPFGHIPPARSHISLFRLSSSYILPTHSRLALLLFIWAFLRVTWLPLCLFPLNILSINCSWCPFEEFLLLWLFASFIDITTLLYNYICGQLPVYFFIPETWPQDIPPFLQASSKHYLWTPGWQGRL